MKQVTFIILFAALALVGNAQPLAFPGAEGFGKYTSGGRNGKVYIVTNLNDEGPGSFRDAVSQPYRTVVFEVGGVIRINSPIVISPNLTIAGQTAPGDGITIYGERISFSKASNTICRYIRFRMGENGKNGSDAVVVAEGHRMIFDHVSISWGKDENFSISSMKVVGGPSDITVQNSIISQGLMDHSMGGLIQSDGGITLYRNLYADNRSRNNKVKGFNQFVNNVVYNWSVGAYILGGSAFKSFANITNNYFITGPDTRSKAFTRGNENFALYARDNYLDENRDGTLDGRAIGREEYGVVKWSDRPFDFPPIPETSAAGALEWIVKHVGCTFPARDEIDQYVIDELLSYGKKGKLIRSEKELPAKGPGNIRGGEPKKDTDRDGMPDEWEEIHGLNPADPGDANGYIVSDIYSNIEMYLNSLVKP
ncbi:MAG: pectate lyase [Odoribacteraceae bacterium]|jgi:pectate lyase|nr:pectate lyase [Odoribacteraceae bacterium]